MCPAMIDEPTSPGRGLPVYQPATEVLDGTCRVPWAVTPSLVSLLPRSMAGMARDTGRAAGWLPDGLGTVTTAPDGTIPSLATGRGTSAGLPFSVTKPTTPNTAAIRPPATTASARCRRVSPIRGRPSRACRGSGSARGISAAPAGQDAPEALDPPDALEAPEAPEGREAPETPEGRQAPEGREAPEGGETPRRKGDTTHHNEATTRDR